MYVMLINETLPRIVVKLADPISDNIFQLLVSNNWRLPQSGHYPSCPLIIHQVWVDILGFSIFIFILLTVILFRWTFLAPLSLNFNLSSVLVKIETKLWRKKIYWKLKFEKIIIYTFMSTCILTDLHSLGQPSLLQQNFPWTLLTVYPSQKPFPSLSSR